jgi:DNA-binding MarR family transcriptional regulator
VRSRADSAGVGRLGCGLPVDRRKLAAETWGSLLQVHATLVPRLDRRLRTATGLPLAWYDVLLELSAAADGRLTMSQLSERVVLSRSRVSRVVDELVRADLVQREPNPDDARSAYPVITSRGLSRFRKAAPVYLATIDQEFAGDLTVTELSAVRRALQRVAARANASPN